MPLPSPGVPTPRPRGLVQENYEDEGGCQKFQEDKPPRKGRRTKAGWVTKDPKFRHCYEGDAGAIRTRWSQEVKDRERFRKK